VSSSSPVYVSYQVMSGQVAQDASFWVIPMILIQQNRQLAPITKQPITISLDFLYNGGTVPTLPANADFSFAASGPQVQITLLATGNIWTTNRSALMQNFVAFLQSIETNCELASPAILLPGSTFRIGQAIADALPAPLLESLFYRYSFSTGFSGGMKPYVDIRPGMRLRVETQASQFLAAGSNLNGYIAGGQSIFRVQTVSPNGGPRVVGFDPFLGTINSPSVSPATGQPVIAGGLIDLQAASTGPHIRLFYPNSVPPPTSAGSVSTTSNPTLVTAQTLAELNSVTNGTPPKIATLFLGRAVAIPEIGVWLNIAMVNTQLPAIPLFLEYVAVGTTVGHILERYAPLPLNLEGPLGVSVQRIYSITGQALTISFIGPPPLPASIFDLPLIAGDVVSLTL
jgi:hypothetical protein